MNIICLNGKNTIQENTIRRSLIRYEEKYYKQIMLLSCTFKQTSHVQYYDPYIASHMLYFLYY